jgi:uncharacterized protein
MTLPEIAILLGSGLLLGFFSGLLGIGGGIVMTPVQYWVYGSMGFSTDIAIKMSFGTTLAVVLPTAISGVIVHNNRGAIAWRQAGIMGSVTFFCSIVGAALTAHLPGTYLKIAFGAIALASAIRMLIPRKAPTQNPPVTNPWVWIAWAIPIGLIGGLLGVGGGVIAVPILVVAMGFPMQQAVATSLGMMLFTSLGGLIGYINSGQNVPGLPEYTVGYVYLPAFLILAVTSFGMARLGAIAAHKLAARQLSYIFVALLFYIGLDMLGIFTLIANLF